MAADAKFEPISMNVGNDPVVIPLMRCIVEVGGSEKELKMRECSGRLCVSSAGKERTP